MRASGGASSRNTLNQNHGAGLPQIAYVYRSTVAPARSAASHAARVAVGTPSQEMRSTPVSGRVRCVGG